MREVYWEHIEWDTNNIIAGSMKVIWFYEKYLPQKIDSEYWNQFRHGCMNHLTGQANTQPVRLTIPAFELAYYGLSQASIQIIEGENILFKTKSPMFVFRDRSFAVLTPSQKSMLFALNKAIGEEMADVYKLDVVPDPVCLVFPKRYYAKKWEFQKAVLLD